MHGMVKRAAASAVPALVGLAVSPATAMAAPHTGRAIAGPAISGREAHERLAQLPRSGKIQGHLAGIASTAQTTADTCQCDGSGTECAATPATPVIPAFPAAFIVIPVYPHTDINGSLARLVHFFPGGGSVNGAPANGIIAYGNGDKIFGNHIAASAGSGINIYRNVGGGNGIGAVASP
jgi:hypothetical protein